MKTVWARSIVLATLALLAFGGGAQATILLTENFGSGGGFPALWEQTINSPNGPPGASWVVTTSMISPAGTPHSATRVAWFNSATALSGNAALLTSPTMNLTSYSSATLTFWMYHDSGSSSLNDTLTPQISINGGTAWSPLGSAIGRYQAGEAHWDQAIFDLSAYLGNSNVKVGFLGISALGNNIFLDDVEVTAETGGVPEPATLMLVALGLAPLLLRRRRA